MAGCCTLVTRATPADGRRAAGPVKACALAASARTSFMVSNLFDWQRHDSRCTERDVTLFLRRIARIDTLEKSDSSKES
jgi:hypothetical protein